MEYEQLEYGNDTLTKAIENQDLGTYYDLLDDGVLLVSHFPYPDCSNSSAAVIREATRVRESAAYPSPARLKAELLKAEKEDIQRRKERYEKQQQQVHGKRSKKPEEGGADVAGDSADAAADPTSTAPTTNASTVATATIATATAKKKTAKKKHVGGEQQQQQQQQRTVSAARAAHQTPVGVELYLEAGKFPDSSYGDRVDIAIGPLLVSERFCVILNWLQSSEYLAPVKAQLEPRKSVLQDSEMLPPPELPEKMEDRYALLGRQFTERNQRLSRLVVHWGREALQFCDHIYFEESKIVTIHRWLVPLEEMLEKPFPSPQPLTPSQKTDAVKREVLDFYGVAKSRVNAVNKAWPLLDYSFLPIENPAALLTTKPVAGRVHRAKAGRPATDPRLAQGLFLNEVNDPSRPSAPSRTLIKAKNKKGEEEAYEFERSSKRFAFMDGERHTDNAMDTLLGKVEIRYDASSVRISGCNLSSDLGRLVPALRGVVANAYLTLHSLDLSDNAITEVPDLSLLPIQKLQLHANRISDWRTIEERVATLPLLYAVTLHGNPLAEREPKYWPMLVALLVRSRKRLVTLKSVDFVTLSAEDYNVAGAYEMFTTGETTVMQVAKTVIRN